MKPQHATKAAPQSTMLANKNFIRMAWRFLSGIAHPHLLGARCPNLLFVVQFSRLALAAVVLLVQAGCGHEDSDQVKASASGDTAFDLAGQPVDPLRDSSSKAVTLIFERRMPHLNRYAEIRRLRAKFSARCDVLAGVSNGDRRRHSPAFEGLSTRRRDARDPRHLDPSSCDGNTRGCGVRPRATPGPPRAD